MERRTVVGMRTLDFTGSDGRPVCGVSLHLQYDDPDVEGFAVEKIFVQMPVFRAASYVPEVGGDCGLVFNRKGKVTDIVRV